MHMLQHISMPLLGKVEVVAAEVLPGRTELVVDMVARN
jgi:hypothetical protein